MKKTIMLSLCCLTALTASANGGGPDETTLNIISIIFVVFGVLQIILFFKVWGMTNNVKEIRDTLIVKSIDLNVKCEAERKIIQAEIKEKEEQKKQTLYANILMGVIIIVVSIIFVLLFLKK